MNRPTGDDLPLKVTPGDVPGYLDAARAGSREALAHLLESYRDYLRQAARQRSDPVLRRKIDPSDLAQITLIEAYRDFHAFTSSTHSCLQTWLATLLRNNLADTRKRYRKAAKRAVSREVAFDSSLQNLADVKQSASADTNSSWERYQSALAELPSHYQEAIGLRHAQRMSFVEMGARLEKTADAARMLYVRAVKALKEKYDNEADATS